MSCDVVHTCRACSGACVLYCREMHSCSSQNVVAGVVAASLEMVVLPGCVGFADSKEEDWKKCIGEQGTGLDALFTLGLSHQNHNLQCPAFYSAAATDKFLAARIVFALL